MTRRFLTPQTPRAERLSGPCIASRDSLPSHASRLVSPALELACRDLLSASHPDQSASIATVTRTLRKNPIDLTRRQAHMHAQHLSDGLAEVRRHRNVALLI